MEEFTESLLSTKNILMQSKLLESGSGISYTIFECFCQICGQMKGLIQDFSLRDTRSKRIEIIIHFFFINSVGYLKTLLY